MNARRSIFFVSVYIPEKLELIEGTKGAMTPEDAEVAFWSIDLVLTEKYFLT